MASLPVVSGSDAVKAFQRSGWTVARQSSSHIIMTKEEKISEAASPALSELVARDVALETESLVAHDAGDHAKANAADSAREALVPEILKAEERVYRTNIAANMAAKENVAQLIRRDAGKCSPQEIEDLIKGMTSTFDDEIWKTEQQLANNLEEQAQVASRRL